MSATFRFTVDEYDRMIRNGIFEDRADVRTELLYGEVIEMNPPGPTHAYVVSLLMYWSTDATNRSDIWVNVQNPLGIPHFDSVPEPDVAWLKARDYRNERPTPQDVLLLIEVAESSLSTDRSVKGKLYADAGIPDYWLVNLKDQCVEVYRDPANGRFQSLQTFGLDASVSPLHRPDVQLSVRSLFQ